MKKITVMLLFSYLLFSFSNVPAYAAPINETDTELCEAFQLALMNVLREPVDQALTEIYKDDKDAPEGLTWASYDTEIIKIKQIYGIGGLYEITLKVRPYYRAHITYGEDEIVVNTNGELIKYKHLNTYPIVDFAD